jgi:hypothetical protein
VSKATNWRANRQREAIRKHGHESKKGGMPYGLFLPPPRPRPSKAALRAEAELLVAEFLAKPMEPGPLDEAGE